MEMDRILEAFSARRLGGEPVPRDLGILLGRAEELAGRAEIELNWEEGWAPWLDTSYLGESDRANPNIMANVRAIAEVCGMMAFVAATDEDEYIGYWRGPGLSPIAAAPLAVLDNEGQFSICGSTFAEALLARCGGGGRFAELRDWFRSLGIEVRADSSGDLAIPSVEAGPGKLHEEFYRRYLGAGDSR